MVLHNFRFLPNGVVNNRLYTLGIHRVKKGGEVLRLLRLFCAQFPGEKSDRKQENRVRGNSAFLGRGGCRQVEYKKMRSTMMGSGPLESMVCQGTVHVRNEILTSGRMNVVKRGGV
jgi:hypothetical protein